MSNRPNSTLVTSYSGNGAFNSFSQQALASGILEINLFDSQNLAITQLDAPLTVCLALASKIKKGERVCLSYYDEQRGKWRCEDKCLTTNGTKREDTLCGQTDHLTNFALLFFGNSNQYEDPCSSNTPDFTLFWISLGLGMGAILLIACCVVLNEVRYQWAAIYRAKLLGKTQSSHSPPFLTTNHRGDCPQESRSHILGMLFRSFLINQFVKKERKKICIKRKSLWRVRWLSEAESGCLFDGNGKFLFHFALRAVLGHV